jgi:type II secretory ATPase GspE/PulE/Tfp pilus assembly ATPase PilB-like protein
MMLSHKVGQSIVDSFRTLMKLGEHAQGEARLTLKSEDESISMRAALTPTAAGVELALHLLPRGERSGFTLESLGLRGEALEYLYSALNQKRGLIVVAGPRASGVTTTLYTLLDSASRPELLLMSVEEVIEHRLPQVSQVPARRGEVSVPAALRAALRHDPDILMVGDIEEGEVALLATLAARNRLVLVGVKAPSAVGAIEKLISLNVPEELLQTTLLAAVGQRVVSRKGGGKIGVFEVFDHTLAPVGPTLLEDAQEKVELGLTTEDEITSI